MRNRSFFGYITLISLLTSEQELQVPGNLLVHIGQVFLELKRLKTTKSPGPNMIPNKILKTFAFEFAPVITDIFNISIKQESFRTS